MKNRKTVPEPDMRYIMIDFKFSRRIFVARIGLLFLLFLALVFPAHGQKKSGEEIPEVVLEAFSQGFYRPALLLYPVEYAGDSSETAEIALHFSSRLEFDLSWSGYVDLQKKKVPEDSTTPDSIHIDSLPTTALRLVFEPDSGAFQVTVQLFEPGEDPFYTGSLSFTSKNLKKSADSAAEEILRRLTGMTPAFRSRIVCVQPMASGGKELVVLAFDGDHRWQLTNDHSIALSPSWSPDGKRIVFTSFRGGGDANLYIADLERRRIKLIVRREGTDAAPTWSPDGKWICFAASEGFKTDLYMVRPDGSDLHNLTLTSAINTSPSWSPTGHELTFMSDRSGTPQIYRIDSDGANLLRLTYDGSYNADPAWSPAGDRIVYVRREKNGFQIRLMDINGDVDVPLTDEPGDHLEPSWSPDGMKISYGYKGKIWVMNSDGSSPRPLLSGGLMPDWSPLAER